MRRASCESIAVFKGLRGPWGLWIAAKCQFGRSQCLAGQSVSVCDRAAISVCLCFWCCNARGLARYAYAMEAALPLISRREQTLLSHSDTKDERHETCCNSCPKICVCCCVRTCIGHICKLVTYTRGRTKLPLKADFDAVLGSQAPGKRERLSTT